MVAMPLSSWAVKLLIAPLVDENHVPSVAVMSVVIVGACVSTAARVDGQPSAVATWSVCERPSGSVTVTVGSVTLPVMVATPSGETVIPLLGSV